MRWNALAMVVRANQAYGELGGHIASYASAAEISRWGSIISFGATIRRRKRRAMRPRVFPAAFGARRVLAGFLEGRLSEERLAHYRQD